MSYLKRQGEYLRKLRLSKNWFLKDVAKAVGVSVTHYGNVERGNKFLDWRVYNNWFNKIATLPVIPTPPRQNKFMQRAAKYNEANPMKNIEPEYFSALLLTLERPWLFTNTKKRNIEPIKKRG